MNNDNPSALQTETETDSTLTREEALAQLRIKLTQGYPTLKQEYGSPRKGVAGPDAAFIVDRATRDALIQADPKSAAILKPYVESNDLKRWRVEPRDLWLIHMPAGSLTIDDCPAIKKHLLPFKDQLEARGAGQQWFELQQTDEAAAEHLAQPKIAYTHLSDSAGFSFDQTGALFSNAGYFLTSGDYYLNGVLNSKLYWFLLEGMSPANQDGLVQLHPEHIEMLPLPGPGMELRGHVGQLSHFCQRTIEERRNLYKHVCQEMVNHLSPGSAVTDLSTQLKNWHVLDMPTFLAEVELHFGKKIEAAMHADWEDFFRQGREQISLVNAEIVRAEHKIDHLVCTLFELTEDEIELLNKI